MSERMVVAFRPEFASLGRPCENALAGKMTSIIYSGGPRSPPRRATEWRCDCRQEIPTAL